MLFGFPTWTTKVLRHSHPLYQWAHSSSWSYSAIVPPLFLKAPDEPGHPLGGGGCHPMSRGLQPLLHLHFLAPPPVPLSALLFHHVLTACGLAGCAAVRRNAGRLGRARWRRGGWRVLWLERWWLSPGRQWPRGWLRSCSLGSPLARRRMGIAAQRRPGRTGCRLRCNPSRGWCWRSWKLELVAPSWAAQRLVGRCTVGPSCTQTQWPDRVNRQSAATATEQSRETP